MAAVSAAAPALLLPAISSSPTRPRYSRSPRPAGIGPGRLRRYSLTCERFDARRAFEIGLVDEVCAPGALDATAAPIIDALLHCPPGSLAGSKAAALKCAGLYCTADELAELARPHGFKRLDDEAGEGLRSFLEKRKPAWYPGEAG